MIGNQYLLVVITQAGWAIFFAIYLSLDDNYNLALFSGRISHLFSLFIPTTWYRFILNYIGEEKRKLLLRITNSICLFFALFIFSPWFIPKMSPMVGFAYYVQAGPVYNLFVTLFFIIVPLSFFELFRKIRKTSFPENEQYKGLFWSAFAGYLGGSLTFFPVYGIPIPQYGLFLLPIYPFGVAYFMIKQKLFDVEELAQAAHRDKLMAIGVLAASINHEVKNPLFVIKGLAESHLEKQKEGLLSGPGLIEKGNEALQKSIECVDRALDIIKRLSSFAKAGVENELRSEPVSITETLDNVFPLVRYELAAHGIKFIPDIPKGLPKISADHLCLEEIFFNLIVNAIQAVKGMNKANGEIRITAGFESGKVCVRVQDNGPGIPEEKLKDVFRPFYTTKQEGTGLGLYITQQLVEKNKGRLTVESQVHCGTIFTLQFEVFK